MKKAPRPVPTPARDSLSDAAWKHRVATSATGAGCRADQTPATTRTKNAISQQYGIQTTAAGQFMAPSILVDLALRRRRRHTSGGNRPALRPTRRYRTAATPLAGIRGCPRVGAEPPARGFAIDPGRRCSDSRVRRAVKPFLRIRDSGGPGVPRRFGTFGREQDGHGMIAFSAIINSHAYPADMKETGQQIRTALKASSSEEKLAAIAQTAAIMATPT